MKRKGFFALTVIYYVLIVLLSGCAAVKEAGKGFIGVSTQVLEENRKTALKKSFALDYDRCYLKVKEILNQSGKESFIYALDPKEKLIAIYFTPADTTPVGIFFTEEAAGSTLIEISSPSIYAKEEIAKRIFAGIDEVLNPKIERKTNVKEESGS
ncbi:MAG TPA: hypothetical protein PL125_00815 [Candidatus Omnitrophota bacterium]|nr:hypothetical protein [Candidatus Omnitrophota bacterium]HPT38728.1 hypothetical protein [Candidatus Omnitrophota bacterium]